MNVDKGVQKNCVQKNSLEERVHSEVERALYPLWQHDGDVSAMIPIEYALLEIFEEYKDIMPKRINKQCKKAKKVYEGKNILPARKDFITLVDEMVHSYIKMEKGNIIAITKHVNHLRSKIESRRHSLLDMDQRIVDATARYDEIRQQLGIPSDEDTAGIHQLFDPPHGMGIPDIEGPNPFATMAMLDRTSYGEMAQQLAKQDNEEGHISQRHLDEVRRLRREMLDISQQIMRFVHKKERVHESNRTLQKSLGYDRQMLCDRRNALNGFERVWESYKAQRAPGLRSTEYDASVKYE